MEVVTARPWAVKREDEATHTGHQALTPMVPAGTVTDTGATDSHVPFLSVMRQPLRADGSPRKGKLELAARPLSVSELTQLLLRLAAFRPSAPDGGVWRSRLQPG